MATTTAALASSEITTSQSEQRQQVRPGRRGGAPSATTLPPRLHSHCASLLLRLPLSIDLTVLPVLACCFARSLRSTLVASRSAALGRSAPHSSTASYHIFLFSSSSFSSVDAFSLSLLPSTTTSSSGLFIELSSKTRPRVVDLCFSFLSSL